jgi:hypothetical protein
VISYKDIEDARGKRSAKKKKAAKEAAAVKDYVVGSAIALRQRQRRPKRHGGVSGG